MPPIAHEAMLSIISQYFNLIYGTNKTFKYTFKEVETIFFSMTLDDKLILSPIRHKYPSYYQKTWQLELNFHLLRNLQHRPLHAKLICGCIKLSIHFQY